jgi:hypothetical protein
MGDSSGNAEKSSAALLCKPLPRGDSPRNEGCFSATEDYTPTYPSFERVARPASQPDLVSRGRIRSRSWDALAAFFPSASFLNTG